MKKIDYRSIDKEIRPLIKELNKVGLKTTQCCCGHNIKQAFLYLDLNSIDTVEIKDMNAGKRLILRWDFATKENKYE